MHVTKHIINTLRYIEMQYITLYLNQNPKLDNMDLIIFQ